MKPGNHPGHKVLRCFASFMNFTGNNSSIHYNPPPENFYMIIIIFYFENVTFFHTKLGSDVCLRVDNQTSGDTLQDLTRPLVEKSPSASYPPLGIVVFAGGMPNPHQQVWIREETLESGNLCSPLGNFDWSGLWATVCTLITPDLGCPCFDL